MAENKQGYFLGGILSAILAGKALLPKILGGIAGTGLVFADKLFGSKGGSNVKTLRKNLQGLMQPQKLQIH